jgi:hypothetical protein
MSDPFVADCSVGIGWVHPSQATDLTRRLLEDAKAGTAVHVPSIWHLEMANALLVAVRRKSMTQNHRQAGLAMLGQLRIVVDSETSLMAFSEISNLAVQLLYPHTMPPIWNWHGASRCQWARATSL